MKKTSLLLTLFMLTLLMYSPGTSAQLCDWQPDIPTIYFWPVGNVEWYAESYYPNESNPEEIYLSGEVENGCEIYLSFEGNYKRKINGYFYGDYNNGYQAPQFFTAGDNPPTNIVNEEEFSCEGYFNTYHIKSISDGYFECYIKVERCNVLTEPYCHVDHLEPPKLFCPAWWNDNSRIADNECYNYAFNEESLGLPGDITGANSYVEWVNLVMSEYGATLVSNEPDYLITHPNYYQGDGYVLILFVSGDSTYPNNENIHFFRRDGNNLWSHKNGVCPVITTTLLNINIDLTNSNIVSVGTNADLSGYEVYGGLYKYYIGTP
jgi:hypothetical protein